MGGTERSDMKNLLLRFLLNWRLERADVKSTTKLPRFPVGTELVRDGRRYFYARKK